MLIRTCKNRSHKFEISKFDCFYITNTFQEDSLRKHPREDVDSIDYTDAIENNDLKNMIQQRERMAGRTLHYGLARVPAPDKYWQFNFNFAEMSIK